MRQSAWKQVVVGSMVIASLAACTAQIGDGRSGAQVEDAMTEAAPNTLTEAERADGWRLLFDGESTTGWRGFRMDAMPDGWSVQDGVLEFGGRGGDIVTDEEFGDFELVLDWRVGPAGNSGIFYRVNEDVDVIYRSAPEYQLLDDAGHADGASELTSAGAAYGLYPAPRGAVRPAGEWNTARIVVRGNQVEHWLNGVQTASYELYSDDWEARVRDSKFNDWPEYGRSERGNIGLQDHGDPISFRNIKVRVP
jgi:hypothetical protein